MQALLAGARCGAAACPALAILVAAGLALAATRPVHAQDAAPALGQRMGLVVPVARGVLFDSDWPARAADRLARAGVPVFARIGEFLRASRTEGYAWDDAAPVPSPHAAAAGASGASFAARDGDGPASDGIVRGPSLAEQRPDLQDGETGQSTVIRFISYRLPWLLTPESAVHALPTLTLGGAIARFDLMAGAMGGRSGAYGEFVLHF